MNPQCARCGKVVYPTEKVNCLDKVLGRGGGQGRRLPGVPVPLPAAPAGRAGQGRAGGASGRAGRWQMQRFKGRRCADPRCHRRRGQPPCHRCRGASGARSGRGALRCPPGNDGARLPAAPPAPRGMKL